MSHWAKILITLELRTNFGPVLLRRASLAVTAQHYTILNCGCDGSTLHYTILNCGTATIHLEDIPLHHVVIRRSAD